MSSIRFRECFTETSLFILKCLFTLNSKSDHFITDPSLSSRFNSDASARIEIGSISGPHLISRKAVV